MKQKLLKKYGSEFNREGVEKFLLCNTIAKSLFGDKIKSVIDEAISAYDEKHRYYHNINHLISLFNLIHSFQHTKREKEILELVALFHDVVYDPIHSLLRTNEERSADWFVALSNASSREKRLHISTIKSMVEETQYGKKEGTTRLSKWFNEADLWTLIYGNVSDLLANEMLILKEYQFNPYLKYREGRIKFLNFIKKHEMCFKNSPNISELIRHVENYVPSIGVYAGSFNPFHVGHQNILEKAGKLFDKVIVAVGSNPEKGKNFMDIDKTVRDAIPFHEVDQFGGALSEYIESVETYAKVTLVRGLRNGYDFNYEINQLRFIEDMYGGKISVVLIPCDREYDYVSSSAIRSIEAIRSNDILPVDKFYRKYLVQDEKQE